MKSLSRICTVAAISAIVFACSITSPPEGTNLDSGRVSDAAITPDSSAQVDTEQNDEARPVNDAAENVDPCASARSARVSVNCDGYPVGTIIEGDYTADDTASLQALSTKKCITGTLILAAPELTPPSGLDLLEGVGQVLVCGNSTLTDFSLPSLESTYSVSVIDNYSLTSFSFPALVSTSARFTISGNVNLVGFTIPVLTESVFTISDNAALESFSAPMLQNLFAPLLETSSDSSVTSNRSLATISLPSLAAVHGSFEVSGNRALANILLPALATIDGQFSHMLATNTFRIESNDSLFSIVLPSLSNIIGCMRIVHNNSLTEISSPVLESVWCLSVADNRDLTSLSAPELSAVFAGDMPGWVTVTDNPVLPECEVLALRAQIADGAVTFTDTGNDDPCEPTPCTPYICAQDCSQASYYTCS